MMLSSQGLPQTYQLPIQRAHISSMAINTALRRTHVTALNSQGLWQPTQRTPRHLQESKRSRGRRGFTTPTQTW